MRRFNSVLQLLGAAALVSSSVGSAAAPLRAGASLPVTSLADAGLARRAAAPVQGESDLVGLPIFAFIGLFIGAVAVVVVVASSGGGSSPG